MGQSPTGFHKGRLIHGLVGSLDHLRLDLSGTCTLNDIAKANERHFLNMATAGFGAQEGIATLSKPGVFYATGL